ncbi:hypothetical protein [Thalassotalea marina]|uniref:Uncharacterized protein n=1 Tax=Thalassotalea marina TaxID=1673741 RepID=A0A919BG96_9GAMM|nr:hypothetical protein [Thalassotalea marina]GHF88962.1 hypothetical protein GCM10017161_15930 [Thalassotalea marina]
MIVILCIAGIFIAASIYFYFKAEGLHQQLLTTRKELKNNKKESKILVESFAIIARKSEESLKHRLKVAKDAGASSEVIEVFGPFVNNYSSIFAASVKGNGEMHKVTQKCYETYQKGSFRRFTGYVGTLDSHIKRAWSTNSLSGLIAFSEAMVFHIESTLEKAS